MTAEQFLAAVGVAYAMALTVAAFLFLRAPRADIFAEVDPVYLFLVRLSLRQRLSISIFAVCLAGLILYHALELVVSP